ncbi:MAG: glycosyltransferase family 4 protein, partial [Kiritimatiellales bacterium]|nr:glycosyltransferase family 4 protein [Kiritimatiellales bacterium]
CFKWRILFGKMAERADAVVTVSNFSASRIAHFFPALEPKLRVIHNASHGVFGSEPSPDLLEKVEAFSAGAPFVLVPGGLSLRKNADLIARAWPMLAKALPSLRLVVSGICEADYLKRLGAHGAHNLVLPGYVSDELLNALYHKATVVWFPSRYEGFGMPVVEAMAAGAPVVASDAASLPEVAGNAALLCGVDDPQAHVDAIYSLVSSPQARAEMCKRSLEQSKQFSWAASASRLEELFQSI